MLNINKLENAITEAKFTKAKLCSTLGIARTTLDSILNGSDTKISTIESISKVLNVKIGFLFDEEVSEVRTAGRDYVEGGKIEHRGTEYNGVVTSCEDSGDKDQVAVLRAERDELRKELLDAQRKIIDLMGKQK